MNNMSYFYRKPQILIILAFSIAGLIAANYVFAVTFSGQVNVSGDASVIGSLSKGSGTFVIDHPLDPDNKLLYHSFVESPDVKNIYDGVATLNESGEATIYLPSYWSALNDSETARFLLTPLNTPAPNLHIKSEIKDNHFTIAGGPPNARVSWQVTGIRHDPYILANPIVVEVDKGPDELVDKGEYLFPEFYDGVSKTTRTIVSKLAEIWNSIIVWLQELFKR